MVYHISHHYHPIFYCSLNCIAQWNYIEIKTEKNPRAFKNKKILELLNQFITSIS